MIDKSNLIIQIVARRYTEERWAARIATTKWQELQAELRELFETLDSVTEQDILTTTWGEDVMSVAEAQAEVEIQRDTTRWLHYERAIANSGEWLPAINMEAHIRASVKEGSPNPEGSINWRYTHDLEPNGLMVRILEWEGLDLTEPVVMNVENHLPFKIDPKGRQLSQYEIPYSEVENFWSQGYMYSGGKAIWNVNPKSVIGRRVREIFSMSFKKDITFASYNRRFKAALVPGGFLPNLSVRTETIFAYDGRIEEWVVQGLDGSGLYDPEHPDMADLISRYGIVAFQITAWCRNNGKLWKGIIVPRMGINEGREDNDKHAIVFDHMQIKSDDHKASHKDFHKKSRADGDQYEVLDSGVHVGIMKHKTKAGRVSSCFELIEQLGPVGPFESVDDFLHQRQTVMELLNEFVDEAMERIRKMGPEGLLGRATRDDPKLARLADFLRMANKKLPPEGRISPLDVPVIKSKIEESLGKVLWPVANGAGIRGKYPMVVIDETITPGTCVIADVPIGKTIADWRFPTILAQGLLTLKVVKPRAHHQINGLTIPNVIFTHPQDITVGQQGDDDGDEVGYSTDQRLVKLFHFRKDRNIYHIEPDSEKRYMLNEKGEKVSIPVWSEEGRRYISTDPMGPVGMLTIWKAGLDAVGAYDMSRAFAVGCQEAIDSQKNFVRPTDPYRAAKLENWHRDERGEYHVHVKGKTDNWIKGKEPGEFPLEIWEEAYEKTLIAHGCFIQYRDKETGELVTRAGWPLGWRTQRKLMTDGEGNDYYVKLRKSIAFSNWELSLEKQNGTDQNWVHHCHDRARAKWLEFEQEWTGDTTLPARELLQKIMAGKGIHMEPTPMSWEEYKAGLRERSGLNWYGKEFGKLSAERKKKKDPNKAPGHNDDTQNTRVRQIDILRETLDVRLRDLSDQDLFDIWWMELSELWYYMDGHTRVYIDDPSKTPKGKKGPWRVGTPNYAFTAVTNSGSGIMEKLGVEMPERCQYMLESKDRVTNIMNWCFTGNTPYKRLTLLAQRDVGHAKHKHDGNGQGIRLGDCPDCMSTLKAVLVRRVRDERKAKEIEGASKLNSAMNRAKQEAVEGWMEESQVKARREFIEVTEDIRDPNDCQELCG